jgi:hypothetical protein
MSSNTADEKNELIGLTQDELREFVVGLGEKPYRARQIHDSIFRRRITSFDAMTDLPKMLEPGSSVSGIIAPSCQKLCFRGIYF